MNQSRNYQILSNGEYNQIHVETNHLDDDSLDFHPDLHHWKEMKEIDKIMIDQYDFRTNVCWNNVAEYRIGVFDSPEKGRLSDQQIDALINLLRPMIVFAHPMIDWRNPMIDWRNGFEVQTNI